MENFCRCGCRTILPEGRKYVHGHNLTPEFARYAASKSSGHLGHKHSGDFARFGKHRIGVPPTNVKPKGTRFSPATEFKKGFTPWNKGKPHLPKEKNPNWRGGIIPEQNALRQEHHYRNWREAVFKRDNYTCLFCDKRGVRLEPHHIKPFSQYPRLRFVVSNGITLCYDCHQLTKSPIFNS